MNINPNKIIRNWLYFGAAFTVLILIVGGITRVTHSGLSMVDWKLIIGSIPPLTESAWIEKFEIYKQFPEFKGVHSHFVLSDFKSIFFWEYLHRMLGRLLSMIFLFPFLFFLYKKWLKRDEIKKLLVLFCLGGCQAFLGWYMVSSGLTGEPDVSHFRLASHLIMAFGIVGYSLWLAFDRQFEDLEVESNTSFRKISIALLLLIICQAVYGAFVAGLNAGKFYTTFPKMDNEWIAEGVTAMEPFLLNFISGIAGVQFIHRYLAWAIVFFVGYIWIKRKSFNMNPFQNKIFNGVSFILIAQFTLGVITLLSGAERNLGVIHQVGAVLLFSSVILLVHRTAK
ncbi:MAG: COX15/CtaA family protein [Flavobacteriales bacterium]|nr:COX15/CtaA family protein [Flavobacteriales bacterium]